MSSEQMIKETASRLREFLTAGNVMGEPIDLGEKTVVPITRFGFGFGAGAGQGKEGGSEGTGGGGGIEPVALIILHKDVKGPEGVQIISLKKGNPVAEVISALSETLAPQVIQAIKSMSQNKAQPESEKKENTG